MATPTSAAARAGASLIPSPTISVGPAARSALTTAILSAGESSACTASSASARPISSAAAVRVAAHHHHSAQAGGAQAAQCSRRVGPDRVGEQERPSNRPIHSHPRHGCGSLCKPRRRPVARRHQPRGGEQAGAADHYLPPGDAARKPAAGYFHHCLGWFERQAAGLRRRDDRCRHAVRRRLFEGGCEA